MTVYYLVRVLSAFLCLLPRRIAYAMVTVGADITYLAWPRGRNAIRDNMSHVLGVGASPGEIDRLARQSLRNYCCYIVDFLRLARLGQADLERRTFSPGCHHIDRALQEGKGAILVGLHMGNWDLGGAVISSRNYPLNVVVESFAPARLNEFVQRPRIEKGMKVIPMERGVKRMVQTLRRNELLALLIDRPCPGEGVAVRFCNAVTHVPRGAATLALKTGATVLPAASVRLPNNTFLTMIDSHISFQPSGDIKSDIQELTQKIMSALERMVQQYPDQWYMFRPMWQTESA